MSGQAPMMQGLMGNYLEQSQEAVRADAGADAEAGRHAVRASRASRRAKKAETARGSGDNRGDAQTHPAVVRAAPKIGFVSLGCPKALIDSELILTQLRAEGYDTAKTYAGADLVIVNTCGFIDDAVKESLDTIGEALAENGKVIVTGCLGAKTGRGGDNLVAQMHPKVLAVTGPHATQEVMDAVHLHLPKPHDPFVDLVPPPGRQADAEALRLPEDQRRLQPPLQLLHHPRHARRPGVAPDRRRADRSARACSRPA